MGERSYLMEEVEIGLNAETIKLLYSLTPENFTEFRERFAVHAVSERSFVIFAAS